MNECRKIIAVDFDGTLCMSIWPNLGPPNNELIHKLIELQEEGARLILWTCREGKQLDAAVDWCNQQGISFDAVNDNLPEIREIFSGNSRKICCDYYIDDRGCSAETFCSMFKKHSIQQKGIQIL